ncbi:MAG: polynucleotide adenylyltransferase PcnB [Betaproteobacteria bacterium]|nr:polynucleotide adenylyltransferase PcnB [Betaproteobacteria bacterium]
MIRKLITRIFSRKASSASRPPALIPVSIHGITRERVSNASRRICESLQDAGFHAFIVGGAVRDLLIGQAPKDYDVATDATPEEVRRLFRRSRIIGRRFRIVHVMQGAETVEVSTFRSRHDEDAPTDEHGRVLCDNIFGSQEEDAARRDFTVNALYYDPATENIVDYHHGVADLKQKTLRVIGEPRVRYREDPVRMLRAVRLAAKLGLVIDPAARRPIRDMADLIENVPGARLFDEMIKLLTSGHALKCLHELRDAGLHTGLLPVLDAILDDPGGARFITLALENTDRRVREGKPVSPGFLFAALLWGQVLRQWERTRAVHPENPDWPPPKPIPALFMAMEQVLDAQAEKLAITRRIAGDIKELWALQPRFESRSGQKPYALLTQPRFKAAYDFLLLRAEAEEIPSELAHWWNDFLDADGPARAEMLLPAQGKKRRRRGGGKKRGASPASDGAAQG